MAAKKTPSYSELEARVAVLEKLLDKFLDKLGDIAVTQKTADKALAMSQEAMVIVTSGLRAQQGEEDFGPVPPGMDGGFPSSPEEQLRKEASTI